MNKIEEFKVKLEALKQLAIDKNKDLREKGFEDESLFEKIKGNVYDIYLKMINVAKNKGEFENEYPYFLENIPKAWHEALAKAIKEEDFEEEQKERVILDTKTEIEALFHSLFA